MNIPTLSGPVGKVPKAPPTLKVTSSANQPADVLLVQRALNKLACDPKVAENGKADDDLIAAISDFQSSWLTAPDGKVDPGGATLRRLAYLANGAWMISPIATKKIERGGYRVGYEPAFSWNRNYRAYLTVHNLNLSPSANLRRLGELPHCIDVTNRNHRDVLSYEDLPQFLSTIGSFGDAIWGSKRYCAIYIARGDLIIGRSRNLAVMTCPIRPLNAKPAVIMPEKDTLPYYHGDGAPLVTPTPINDKYWFRSGGEFVTDNDKRGLNCCTYPSAVYGLTSGTDSGEHIANAIAGGTANDVDGESYDDMMTFLTKHRTGTYLFWYDYSGGGHVVLVVDGEAHEWSQTTGHYKHTSIPTAYDDKKDGCLWGNKKTGKYWVRCLD
ncbi:MAG TPA: peptidoglycan-binding domain-containing protein [Burkholderiales bacterium]|nr:peptidoglycan-binding domain-containing protein [Burkholderiales bacterium]